MKQAIRSALAVLMAASMLLGTAAPTFAAGTAISAEMTSGFNAYQILTFSNKADVRAITQIKVNGTEWTQRGSKSSVFGSGCYYLDGDAGQIYFDASALQDGDGVTLVSGESTQTLTVTNRDGIFAVSTSGEDGGQENAYTLCVRLVGSFEAALVGQKDYDAISGGSTNVTANKNSDAVVEVALVEKGTQPTEEDWTLLSDSGIRVDPKATSVNLDGESGMAGAYSTYDSSITLGGTPAKAGNYAVSVTVTDTQGRTATSNALPFTIYEGTEALSQQLKTENCRQMQDGTYIWDMEPWAISVFGGENETVTVPAEIKAWYGSDTSGTYGKLGYAIPQGEASAQTLIVPKGCDLTLVNMDILSSVKIVVEKGASLTLMDSVIQGVVEVNGGTFSMGDSASVNGQVVLNDGSVLAESLIYSNTNNIANGSEARQNTAPVVVVNGAVTLTGTVAIRGDESPTGTDTATGTEYAGQTGLEVKGTLTLAEGAVLAVYGGGHYYTTSVGGTAIRLTGGTITGEGQLIAVAGAGTKAGGDGVSGTGTISPAAAYLEGGNSSYRDAPAGVGAAAGVALDCTNLKQVSGTQGGGFDSSTYWSSTTAGPDLSAYSNITQTVTPPVDGTTGSTTEGSKPTTDGTTGSTTEGNKPTTDGTTGSTTEGNKPTTGGSSSQVSGGSGSSGLGGSSGGSAGNFGGTDSAAPGAGESGLTADSFSDTQDHWAADGVTYVLGKGYFTGTSATTFSPDTAATRGMLMTVLARRAGEDTSGGATWYEKGMTWAVAEGISDGTNPLQNVTREQLVTMLYRAVGRPAATAALSQFSDGDQVSPWAADAMAWAVEQGILQGTTSTTLSPKGKATRAQLATILQRVDELD